MGFWVAREMWWLSECDFYFATENGKAMISGFWAFRCEADLPANSVDMMTFGEESGKWVLIKASDLMKIVPKKA